MLIKTMLSHLTLRRFNNLLTIVVILFAAYLISIPYKPAAEWWVRHEAPLISKAPTVQPPAEAPQQNTLLIPSIGLEQPVHEGTSKSALSKGVWHRPNSSSPEKGSNTVFAGHRFTYSDPAVFYNLDKVSRGDQIVVFWDQERYDYRVSDVRTVAPTNVGVEAPSSTPRLTVYTCTPLWTSEYRLVITAELERQP